LSEERERQRDCGKKARLNITINRSDPPNGRLALTHSIISPALSWIEDFFNFISLGKASRLFSTIFHKLGKEKGKSQGERERRRRRKYSW